MTDDGSGNWNEIAAEALWYTPAGSCSIQKETVLKPCEGSVLVQSLHSGISRGTESLVFRGLVPESEWSRMRAPFQEGDFSGPVKYGYASVGKVLRGDAELVGQTVFALFPHQSVYSIPSEACVPVPDHIPAERAVLAANMETALNALWDGKPSPGDHISVVGGGVVGLLTAYVCSKLPGSVITLIDINTARAQIAGDLGLKFRTPDQSPADQDLVFHTSASPDGLATALRCAGNEAAVVEMSWYGARPVPLHLGGDFHSRRLKLISSQVGSIRPDRQGRWSLRRRLETAMSLLDDPLLDLLLTDRIPFSEAPMRVPEVLNDASSVLAAVLDYEKT